MANSQCIWAKTSWECVPTQEQRQTWEKYRNARQKQGSVKSICTITLLAQVVCTLPGCLCVPAKSIHPSLLQRAKPAHRDRRQQHTPREVMPRGKSGETGENHTSYAKTRRESYLLCLSNSSFFNVLVRWKWCVQGLGFSNGLFRPRSQIFLRLFEDEEKKRGIIIGRVCQWLELPCVWMFVEGELIHGDLKCSCSHIRVH